MRDRENSGMSGRLILALMAVWVARVTGECGKPPQLTNGALTSDFSSKTSFAVGTTVRYDCFPGYHFREGGSRSITCGPNSVWEPLKAICDPRNCGNPGDILNGYYEASSTTLGEKAVYSCDVGYMLVGRRYRLCLTDGWDGQVPTCEIVTCGDPEPISNGKVSSPNTRDEVWQYGMIATYSCLDGYTLIGDEDIACSSSGQWNKKPPSCKVVSCQRPPLSENVIIVSGFGPIYRYRDTITYRCKPGYVMVGRSISECSENNTFVPLPPICKLATAPTKTATTTPPESTEAGTAVTTAVTPTSSKNRGIIIGCVVGVCSIVGIAVAIWYYRKKKRHTTFEKVAMNTQTEEVQVKSNVADC